MKLDQTTLNNVAQGQAGKLFARELAKVLENIADDRISPTAARVIVLEFKFTPAVDRVAITTAVRVQTKLPQPAGAVGLMYAVNDDGELKASNIDPTQLTLADQLKDKRAEGGIS